MGAGETVKHTIAEGLRQVARALPRPAGRRVVVLCYHSIHPSLPFRTTTPGLFAQHLAWLKENCDSIPFSQIHPASGRSASGRPRVSITLDDGYADNHQFALPLLADAGLHATFFLTAGLVEREPPTLERFRTLRMIESEAIQPLEWGQVREILQARMDIGAHSHSHANLARLTLPDLEFEVSHSKRVIEDRTGHEVTTMAYPFGRPKVHVTDRVVRMVRRAGYKSACTVVGRGVRSTDDRLTVPRIFVTDDPVAVLRDKVLGVWDLIGEVREKMPLAVARIISPRDFRV